MIKHDLDNPDDLGESLLKNRSVFSIKYPYKLFFPTIYSLIKPEYERINIVVKIVRDIKTNNNFSFWEKNSFIKISMQIIVILLTIKEIFSAELGVKKRPGTCEIK